jgi:hypothetical protein
MPAFAGEGELKAPATAAEKASPSASRRLTALSSVALVEKRVLLAGANAVAEASKAAITERRIMVISNIKNVYLAKNDTVRLTTLKSFVDKSGKSYGVFVDASSCLSKDRYCLPLLLCDFAA